MMSRMRTDHFSSGGASPTKTLLDKETSLDGDGDPLERDPLGRGPTRQKPPGKKPLR